MWVFALAIVFTVALALILLAAVAISAGRLQGPRAAKWESLADTATRHMNGQGKPPKVFSRLDELREDWHSSHTR